MTDDISLSQTLGALRIANPDDLTTPPISPLPTTSPNSIPTSPTPSSLPSSDAMASSTMESTHNAPSRNIHYSVPEPYSSPPSSNPRSNPSRQSTSFIPPNTILNQPRSYGPLTNRPMSGIYHHSNGSGGSQTSHYGSYRYNDDPPQQIAPPPHRSSSRSQPGIATRNSEFMVSANGLPPRRSSRRVTPTSNPEDGPLHSNNNEDWHERGAAVGTRKEVDSEGRTVTKLIKKGVKDFEFGRTLGEGSYSTVMAATDRSTLREYAIKVLDKRHIIKEKKVKYVNIEKDTLNRLNSHPGIVKLYYTFQDEASLYFVLDLAANGELLSSLKKIGTFDEECTRFYGAQILDAIAYMHSKGVIHRDLKPENVLLDVNMNIKITDFGTAKILEDRSRNTSDILPSSNSSSERSASFVGTAEYVSPELLTAKEGGKPTDLWAFGCIIYQLLCGRPPFKGATEYLTFEKILALDYTYPVGFPPIARDLIERLLVSDPSKRLTVGHVQNHEFFTGIQWGLGLWKTKAPRLRPYVAPPSDPIRLNPPSNSIIPPNKVMKNTSPSQSRPSTRLITSLSAPTQLDIEWSPVLTRDNERILKLGNLVVTVSPATNGSGIKNGEEAHRKLSRFFMNSSTHKKRQRLVMVTSSGRIIVVASGGDEKKAKLEISLLTPGTVWRSFKDSKNLTVWAVDTRDKHFLFEPPPSPLPEADGTAIATGEWLDILVKARELGVQLQQLSVDDLSSASPRDNNEQLLYDDDDDGLVVDGVNIPTATRQQREQDEEVLRKGRKRFSRRQSKGGLAAVF